MTCSVWRVVVGGREIKSMREIVLLGVEEAVERYGGKEEHERTERRSSRTNGAAVDNGN